jgi:hypothetical protein
MMESSVIFNERGIIMKPKSTPHFSLGQTVFKAALVALGIISCGSLVYAVTAAGTNITNQATASYEVSGVTYSVASNVVVTTVQAVGSLRLEADQSVAAAPGEQVALFHQLFNVGNIDETVTLAKTQVTSPTDDIDLSNVDFYVDSNNNGTYDPGIDQRITTPISLAARREGRLERVAPTRRFFETL